MSLTVKCQCPSCFQKIYLGECKIFSQIENRVLKEPRGLFARWSVERLDGPQYTEHDACRLCKECTYRLPRNIEDVPSLILAIVGDTSSGKSHYIAALIQQLKMEWMADANRFVRITCLTPDVEEEYQREYFDIFLDSGVGLEKTLPATSNKARPLIYNLVTQVSAKHPATEVNLMIYDTAGEDFAPKRLTQYARFVLNATAFIFVADPLTMAPITNELSPELQTRWQADLDAASKRRAIQSLNNAIALVERFRSQSSGSSLRDVPIAVMLSKSDLLEYVNLPDGSSQYTFMGNAIYGDYVDLVDIDQVSEEVQAVLIHYKQKSLLAATTRFHQVKFFATSAAGSIPDDSNNFRSVEPRRCLDPLLWILYRLKILEGKRR